jgi:hypothetical protein
MNAEGQGSSDTIGKTNHANMGDKRQGKDGNNEQEAKRLKQQEGQEDQEEEAEQITFVLVKTKTEDGGSPVAPSTSKGRDAFSHYSNDDVRMRHLLGLEDAEAANEDIRDHLDAGVQADKGSTSRKTRLSFELHDSAFYDEWFRMLDQV